MSIFISDGTVRHEVVPHGTGITRECIQVDHPPVDVFASWLSLAPIQTSREISRRHSMINAVQQIIHMTGWSNRKVATAIGTSHPTVAALLRGKIPERVGGLAQTVEHLTEVIYKIWIACAKDRSRVDSAMQTLNQEGKTAYDLIVEKNYARAYLAALDSTRPIRTPGGLITPMTRRNPSLDTALLVNDDGE